MSTVTVTLRDSRGSSSELMKELRSVVEGFCSAQGRSQSYTLKAISDSMSDDSLLGRTFVVTVDGDGSGLVEVLRAQSAVAEAFVAPHRGR